MSNQTSDYKASDVRATMGPRRPAGMGKIERASNPRHALIRLLPYLQPFKVALALVLGGVVIYTGLGLIGPYLLGVAIDQFITPKQATGLARIAGWMLAAYVLNNLFQVIVGWIMAAVSQRALKQVRRDLFGHLQQLPLSFFDQNPTAS